MQQHGQLTRHRDHCPLFGVLSSAFADALPKAPQVAVLPQHRTELAPSRFSASIVAWSRIHISTYSQTTEKNHGKQTAGRTTSCRCGAGTEPFAAGRSPRAVPQVAVK